LRRYSGTSPNFDETDLAFVCAVGFVGVATVELNRFHEEEIIEDRESPFEEEEVREENFREKE